MTKTQMIIDEMHQGKVAVIIENISAKTPILVLNAIMAGTKMGITETAFIDGVKLAEKRDTMLLGIPISKFATASLHLLGIEEYTGDDPVIISMIESRFEL